MDQKTTYIVYKKFTLNVNVLINKWWKKYHTNTNQKRVESSIWISDRAVFMARKDIRHKEGHCIIIKGSIPHEAITTVNMYGSHKRVSNYVRQKLIELQGET